MEHETDAAVSPDYFEVAKMARELVRKTINKLASPTLQHVINSPPSVVPREP